ncbi:MAG TPA: glycosyltransferase family 2 protein [Casimicrobiaceae bacterium]|jgi:glycosyltransferase involved in cell wall biosynthesis
MTGFAMQTENGTLELTVLMPCLNEVETIQCCIRKARQFIDATGIAAEVLVADNGSSDDSRALAAAAGARIVSVANRGYGAALIAGIDAARGRYVIMGDADDSYDFSRLEPFVAKLRDGYDLVVGNRFHGGIAPHAMPLLHKYLGNPALSFFGRLFFAVPIGDFHCGLRGFKRSAIQALNLTTPGMEFASEMIVRAGLAKLRIVEVATTLSPDGRSRPPHLRTWRDGWRHLRFLLLHSPDWLFLYPGVVVSILGLIVTLGLLNGPVQVGVIRLDVHTLLYGMAAVQIGVQLIFFALIARGYANSIGILPAGTRGAGRLASLSLEWSIATGTILFVVGFVLGVIAVQQWSQAGLQALDPSRVMRLVIPSVGLMVLGSQLVMNAFVLALLAVAPKQPRIAAPTASVDPNPAELCSAQRTGAEHDAIG